MAIPIARTGHAAEGIRVGRAAGSIDLEMLGRALQGLALVAPGAVAEGIRALDEVNTAVVAGELTDLIAIGLACCYMIAACDRVRDYDRAVQWCTRLKAFCAKCGLRPPFAVCRTQCASICMWRARGSRRSRSWRARPTSSRSIAANPRARGAAAGAAETTIVLDGQGPVEFKYVNPADDPRNAKSNTR
jgi:hypothetical protein